MNLGIIIDSASGLNQKAAKAKGWGFVPLHLFIDNKDYRDGIDLDASNLFDTLNLESEVRTSASSPAEILDVYKNMSKKYDHVIVYSISSKISSQNNNLKFLAEDFNNIHVLDAWGSIIGIEQNCEKIEELAKKGESIEDIINWGNNNHNNTFSLLVPKTLKWLVKGGRVKNNVAAMAKMLKIVPQLAIDNGEISKFGKGRNFEKTIMKSAKTVQEKTKSNIIYLRHVNNKNILKYKKNIEETLHVKVIVRNLSPSISLHVGLEAVGISAFKS